MLQCFIFQKMATLTQVSLNLFLKEPKAKGTHLDVAQHFSGGGSSPFSAQI